MSLLGFIYFKIVIIEDKIVTNTNNEKIKLKSIDILLSRQYYQNVNRLKGNKFA